MSHDTGPRVCAKCGQLKLAERFPKGSSVCDACMHLGMPKQRPKRRLFVCRVCERILISEGNICGPCTRYLRSGKVQELSGLYREIRPDVPSGNIYAAGRYKSQRAKYVAAMCWLREEGLRRHRKKGGWRESNQGLDDNEGEGWKGDSDVR